MRGRRKKMQIKGRGSGPVLGKGREFTVANPLHVSDEKTDVPNGGSIRLQIKESKVENKLRGKRWARSSR